MKWTDDFWCRIWCAKQILWSINCNYSVHANIYNFEHLAFTIYSILSEISEISRTFYGEKTKKLCLRWQTFKYQSADSISDCFQLFDAFIMSTFRCDWMKRQSATQVTASGWRTKSRPFKFVSSEQAEKIWGDLRSSAWPNRLKRKSKQEINTHLQVWQAHTHKHKLF